MEPLTLFTWGYWGWGSAADKLVLAVDAVEASRGFSPPMFVDIRLSRSVRAPGFDGRAFEDLVGVARYRWLDALGNVAVREGGPMRIKDPGAAETLLDLAEECCRNNQRILFFCSCEFPGIEGDNGCHRVTVARLVLEAAARRKRPIQVVEWPGGEPILEGLEFTLTASEFAKLDRGASSIPLDDSVDLAEVAAIPWCSVVVAELAVEGGGENSDDAHCFLQLTGPARYKKGRWYLPVYRDLGPDLSDEDVRREAIELRDNSGLQTRRTEL